MRQTTIERNNTLRVNRQDADHALVSFRGIFELVRVNHGWAWHPVTAIALPPVGVRNRVYDILGD